MKILGSRSHADISQPTGSPPLQIRSLCLKRAVASAVNSTTQLEQVSLADPGEGGDTAGCRLVSRVQP